MNKKLILHSILALTLILFFGCASTRVNTSKGYQGTSSNSVQIVINDISTLSAAEKGWLPEQIKGKLKSNLQDYLGFSIVADSETEKKVKELQAKSENIARDEDTAIELGKISTAKFALFTTVRRTIGGYSLSANYINLKTGEVVASVGSKSYTSPEYLYGSTGAIDGITLLLANKLGIKISELNKKLLSEGSSSFNIEAQEIISKQNEAQYKRMMNEYDAEISRLKRSNDLNAVQSSKRLEAEKALLVEKQKTEKKRQEELKAQKQKIAADAKLETERSNNLKNTRDKLAKDAETSAARIRNLNTEKQDVLGQIYVIESKKRALLSINQDVEDNYKLLYWQMENDRKQEEIAIRNKAYSTVELDSKGKPTTLAIERREKKVLESNERLYKRFLSECEKLQSSVQNQQDSLLSEISTDRAALTKTRTVSSLGDELKVSFGTYEGGKNGWNAYISLYSEGTLLYTDSFIVNYETLSDKKAPDMENELDDNVIDEYTNNIDMYNSLLIQGYPIVNFELEYNVASEPDDKPSQYKFNFSKLRVINTASGKVNQVINLNKQIVHTMKPVWDLRTYKKSEVLKRAQKESEKEKNKNFEQIKNLQIKEEEQNKYDSARTEILKDIDKLNSSFIEVADGNFKIMKESVSQNLYTAIMKENPSHSKGNSLPVENISKYDAIYFCNELSRMAGFTPVYSVKGTTDVSKWNYIPHKGKKLSKVKCNKDANGYRLPTVKEWEKAKIKNELPTWCWNIKSLWEDAAAPTGLFFAGGISVPVISLISHYPRETFEDPVGLSITGGCLSVSVGLNVLVFSLLQLQTYYKGNDISGTAWNHKPSENIGLIIVRNSNE